MEFCLDYNFFSDNEIDNGKYHEITKLKVILSGRIVKPNVDFLILNNFLNRNFCINKSLQDTRMVVELDNSVFDKLWKVFERFCDFAGGFRRKENFGFFKILAVFGNQLEL